ncbi:MAG TPA: aminotransferase class IV [Planctomycetota bacterium]|nr:aminotransferase class IV [Planctomycetota bacterium]
MLQQFDPRNRDIVVNVNGLLVHRDQAAISPFDSVVQGGDAVWEGLRLYGGCIFRLGAHLDRLRRSAEALSFAQIPSQAAITQELARTLEANGMRDGVHIRLTLTRGVKITSGMDPRLNQSGPTLIVLAEHKAPVYAKSGLTLITSRMRRPGPEVLDQHIHSNNLLTSILAKLEATAAGADDALLLDGRGFVAETNATHLFLVKAGKLATPRTLACPEGITRATVIEVCARQKIECEARDLSLVDFYRADEIFCTGTMGELAAVTKLDGHTIGSGEVGPLTRRLSELYRELTATEGERVVA